MTRGARRDAPPRAEVAPVFDAINDQFHDAYDRARLVATRDGPVFVMLADTLVVFRGSTREAFSFSPRAFHVIKSIAHAPVALYAMLEPHVGGALDAAVQRQLHRFDEQVAASQERLRVDGDARALAVSTRADLEAVLDTTRVCSARALVAEPGREALQAWAGAIGPTLLRLIHAATKLQLEALHVHTEAALRGLTASERGALQVVVIGDHQARARSLGMQYFRKRLAEPPGLEKRVTYGEGVEDEQSALELVGTRRFDRGLARSFFANELRMQRDILGDAAAELLEGFEAAPIT